MPQPSSPLVAVVGGGPAGLMAAEVLAAGGARVTLYDRMPSVGRKFLMAGRGGLNLTHSEELWRLLGHYGQAQRHLSDAIVAFPPEALRAWCEGLGQETFVGTSGHVFPKAMKASPLLRAWLARLVETAVTFKLRHRWGGWDEVGRLVFAAPEGKVAIEADATILALGGASWPRLGSDAGWMTPISAAGIAVAPLRPANCAVLVDWSAVFRDRFAGHPLKRLQLSFAGVRVRGEAIVTRTGLEGGGIYALSAALREAVAAGGEAILHIDLRRDIERTALERRLAAPRDKQSLATFLRKAVALSPVEIGLLHEVALRQQRRLADLAPTDVAEMMKAVPVPVRGVADIARAISTAGGILFAEMDQNFMLRGRPGVFVAGEMLDWEAPTGGYLLQGCFSTGAAAAKSALTWLGGAPD